ncbi:MAG: amidase [Desulfobacterales bacterium]|nr:amidase [Desulfobacterales bacterium]
MNKSALHFQTIIDLARNLRSGKLSPVELTEHFLARIQKLNGRLNAFRQVCPGRALKEAKAAERALRAGQDRGVLHGIPYALKDIFDVQGLATAAGARVLEKNIAARDAFTVQQLSRAGMILLGKTHTVQLAYSGIGINHDYGTPHNPWNQTHYIPGGSSSGSAVAVAAGMAPMALGSDTGGSVRIPAALCGVTGLKTTVGRISRAGVYPLSWTMDSVGPLTRSAEDAAQVYNCLQGVDPEDDSTWNMQPQDGVQGLKNGVRGLRLAFAESMFGQDLDAEVAQAVRQCGQVFENMGAQVERIEFPEARAVWQLNRQGLIIAAEAYANHKELVDSQFDRLDPVVALRIRKGKDFSASEYLENALEWRRLRKNIHDSLRNIDGLLVPTTSIAARPVSVIDQSMETYFQYNLTYLRNTSVGNMLNLCGLSVPCGFTRQGLPVGLLIYGKPFQEDRVLQAGYAFQQVTDWHNRTPDLSWVDAAEPQQRALTPQLAAGLASESKNG